MYAAFVVIISKMRDLRERESRNIIHSHSVSENNEAWREANILAKTVILNSILGAFQNVS